MNTITDEEFENSEDPVFGLKYGKRKQYFKEVPVSDDGNLEIWKKMLQDNIVFNSMSKEELWMKLEKQQSIYDDKIEKAIEWCESQKKNIGKAAEELGFNDDVLQQHYGLMKQVLQSF